MHGVGLDLLDIARLERALERRPALAARLFSADELAYAAAHARPGPAARGALLREGGRHEGARARGAAPAGDRGRPRRGGAAVRAPRRRRGAPRAHELGATVLLTLTHTAHDGGRRGGGGVTPPALGRAAADAERIARRGPLGDRRAPGSRRSTSWRPRPRDSPRSSRRSRPRATSSSSAAAATTAVTATPARACCARPGARSACSPTSDPAGARAATPPSQLRAPAGRPAAPRSTPRRSTGAAVVVDALLGTGFSGEPRGLVAEAIARDRALAACPSSPATSRAASTRRPARSPATAVRAVATATFHAAKPGPVREPRQGARGRGARRRHRDPAGRAGRPSRTSACSTTTRCSRRCRRADRAGRSSPAATCSSRAARAGCSAPPILASEAATRAGAGYVTACVPESEQPVAAAHLVEVMQLALPGRGRPPRRRRRARRPRRGASARGRARARARARAQRRGGGASRARAAAQAPVALVLDADGLNAHAGLLEDLAARPAPTVLTPHEGELGRLLGVPADEVRARRLHHAREAARRAGAVVVLKGDDTLVAEPGGDVARQPGRDPGARDGGHGRRPQRRARRAAGARHRAGARRRRGGPAACARGPARRRAGSGSTASPPATSSPSSRTRGRGGGA